MECKCSLDNNYEIIGLCDLDEFNEKISEFEDSSWKEINLSKAITMDENRPNIKKIVKTYLDIKITSSKIVESLKADNLNIEGSNLTGKMLLVSGVIYQRIIYRSDNNSLKAHSFRLKYILNSSITLDEYVDLKFDKYYVYPFIEDASFQIINPKKIYININLFLFAHKVSSYIPLNIDNKFIFNDSSNTPKKEVAIVSFNSDNKTLVATFTGELYNTLEDESFSLKNSRGTITKAKATLKRNKDGSEFESKLNNQKFNLGDLIVIDYIIYNNRAVLRNYPNMGDNYDMGFLSDHVFKITQDGIIPYILPTMISLTSPSNIQILNIGFDIFSKSLLAHMPTLEFTNPAYKGQEYFKIIVKGLDSREKYQASIQGNEQGAEIARNLLGKPFEYGDIIELIYKEGNRIKIYENPYPTATKNPLTGTSQSFKITKTGLIKI